MANLKKKKLSVFLSTYKVKLLLVVSILKSAC